MWSVSLFYNVTLNVIFDGWSVCLLDLQLVYCKSVAFGLIIIHYHLTVSTVALLCKIPLKQYFG